MRTKITIFLPQENQEAATSNTSSCVIFSLDDRTACTTLVGITVYFAQPLSSIQFKQCSTIFFSQPSDCHYLTGQN